MSADDTGSLTLERLGALRELGDRHCRGVDLVITLEAKGRVRRLSLLERVLHGLAERACADALEGSQVSITTRDVGRSAHARAGSHERWVEVVIQEPGPVDTPSRARIAAPLLTGGEGEVALVDVSRTPGRGSVVRLLLPGVDVDAGEAPREQGPLVLLAEDDHTVRENLAETLRGLGYRVVGAANGVAALEAADRLTAPIDLLLTDVMMPRMSGIELARRLAARQPGLRTLFVSALPLPRGAVLPGPFVPKPLDLTVLLEQIPALVAGILGPRRAPEPPGMSPAARS